MCAVTAGCKKMPRPLQISPPHDARHLIVEFPHLGDEGRILVPPLLLEACDLGSRLIGALDGFRWCRHGEFPDPAARNLRAKSAANARPRRWGSGALARLLPTLAGME
jgi:hypothetical protein